MYIYIYIYLYLYTTNPGEPSTPMRATSNPPGTKCADSEPAVRRGEIGVFFPNNQRQHRRLHVQQDLPPYAFCYWLCPVSAALAKISRMDSISTSIKSEESWRSPPLPAEEETIPWMFQDFCLNAKARIWPWLSYQCRVRSTADSKRGLAVRAKESDWLTH